MSSSYIQKTILWLALAALLAGCSGGAVTATVQSTAVQPSPAPTSPPPTQPPATAAAVPAARPASPSAADTVGGNQIKQGSFAFDLRIYRDPALNKNPASSSQYSDLEGFGEYMTWVYNGPPLQGAVYEFWGVQPNITQLNSYGELKTGDTGGRSGGIFLPGGPYIQGSSKPGELIKLVLRVETPRGKFGASLTFTLKKTAKGLEPANITVRALGSD